MVDVAVIGGGLSGLAASVELASRGARVALFEAGPKLGGRCYSYIDEQTGDVVDNGQHVLLGAYHHLLRYLSLIGTRSHLKEQRALRLPLYHPDKGPAAFDINFLPHPLDLTAGALKFKLLSLQDRRRLLNVALALRKLDPVSEREIARLTVEEWLTALRQSEEARDSLWYPIAVSAMNESPARASALLFARALKAAFLGTKFDSAFLFPTIGQSELYVKGAVEYLKRRKSQIALNAVVSALEIKGQDAAGVRVSGGKVIRAGHVVSAVPHDRLKRFLPSRLRRILPFTDLQDLEFSPIVSLHLWFDKDFMREDFLGLIGCEVQWIFNRRRIVGGAPKEGGFLSAVISGASGIVDYPKQKLVDLTLSDIRRAMPESSTARFRRAVVIKEKRATFSATPEAEPLRPPPETPLRRFLLAGDWTATGLPATIEGAVKSGFTAADLVGR